MKNVLTSLVLAGLFTAPALTRADEVTDWNQTMVKAFALAGVSPLAGTRLGAIVEGSVFDAVNGIERRYTPVHVAPDAPPGASKQAAAIQAAYESLVVLFPAQKPTFDAQLANSLNALHGSAKSIANGQAWGQTVANQILAWRNTDGITPMPPLPPYVGGTGLGEWRPTPPGFLPGAGVPFAATVPWVLTTPFQFRPPGPPALDSLQYAQDFVETKRMGRLVSSERTADETLFSTFWNSSSVVYFWNTVALRLSQGHHYNLSQNARLFAHLNIGMADAGIACFEAKYHYSFWRPVTAIPLADADGNVDTVAEPSWLPLLITPNFPEYPSGHSTTSGGATTVLAHYFGINTPFWIDSDGLPDVVRTFANFNEARDEIANARIFGGIHFRTACVDGFATGTTVGNYVLQNSLQPLHGHGTDDDDND